MTSSGLISHVLPWAPPVGRRSETHQVFSFSEGIRMPRRPPRVAFWAIIHSIPSSGKESSHEAREPKPPRLTDRAPRQFDPARQPSETAQLHSIRHPPQRRPVSAAPEAFENLSSPSSREGRPDRKRVTDGHSHQPGPHTDAGSRDITTLQHSTAMIGASTNPAHGRRRDVASRRLYLRSHVSPATSL